MLSVAPENALAESESTLLSSRGVWEHLEVLRCTGEVARSVWEDCVLLLYRITFCWCSLDTLFSSGLEYSAGSSTSIGRNVSLSHQIIGETTKVSNGHSLYHCQESSMRCSVTPTTNKIHECRQWSTLHPPEATRELYYSTKAISFPSIALVQSKPMKSTDCIDIWTGGLPVTRFNSDHLLTFQDFAICNIWCTASWWATSSSVWIAFIKMFTVEYNSSAQCLSITVSSSEKSDPPQHTTLSDNTTHGVDAIPVELSFEVTIQFSLSGKFASQYCFYCSTDGTHHEFQNSIHRSAVGHCMIVWLWMLTYQMKYGSYSIAQPTCHYSCSYSCGWDSHFPHATWSPVCN